MAKTVVGLYDDYSDAQAAVNDLMGAGFTRDEISIVANNSGERFSAGSDAHASHGGGGGVVKNTVGGAAEGAVIGGLTGLAASLAMLLIPGVGPVLAVGPLAATLSGAGLGAMGGGVIGALTGLGIPKEEAHHYAEGVRRGGTLVTVRTDDNRADEAATILNRHHAIDIDQRGGYHKSTGFTEHHENLPHYTPEQIHEDRTKYNNYATTAMPVAAPTAVTTPPATNFAASDRTVAAGETVTVPVIEEHLAVGKRQVQGGGARVHTHVIETPVSEQVTLHEEHVVVDRHAVNRPVSQADLAGALQERTIEVTETAEVPVVAKEARVVEEVTIGKQATDRVETITDTVRRTDVDVDEIETERDLRSTGTTVSGTTTNRNI